MSTLHLHIKMTAQEYIQSALDDLASPIGSARPDTKYLIEAIYKFVMSKKFRKYSCTDELKQQIHKAIELSVSKSEPIKLTFLQGAYKLWRLDETPEVDWGELFAAMYYTAWLKPICEIYEPGVWFDYFVDDLILPLINTSSLDAVKKYLDSYKDILTFLKQYQPANFKMTINGVGEQFPNPKAFEDKLKNDVERHKKIIGKDLPDLTDERIAMIDLNVETNPELLKDPKWRQKNALIHDAYISLTKKETDYHWKPDKIKVFTQPLPSGTTISVGSTKDSIVKAWVGVGALRTNETSYRQTIVSYSQLQKHNFNIENVSIKGLVGKNFNQVRILD